MVSSQILVRWFHLWAVLLGYRSEAQSCNTSRLLPSEQMKQKGGCKVKVFEKASESKALSHHTSLWRGSVPLFRLVHTLKPLKSTLLNLSICAFKGQCNNNRKLCCVNLSGTENNSTVRKPQFTHSWGNPETFLCKYVLHLHGYWW